MAFSLPAPVLGETDVTLNGRDHVVSLPRMFRLSNGGVLQNGRIRARVYGRPGKPVVLAAGGVSASRILRTEGADVGWWTEVVRRGGGLDLDRHQVIGVDFLPDADARPIAVSTQDQARAFAIALDALSVERLHGFVGASYGGMVALAFAALFPERIDRLVTISAAEKAHPMATALRGVQRRVVQSAARLGDARAGLSLARQIAMTTYRTEEEFADRFGPEPGKHSDTFDICDYLIARGDAYAALETPERFLALSESLDRHRVDPKLVRAATLCIGVPGDRQVPVDDSRRLADSVAGEGRFAALPSRFGHDAFLLEPERLNALLREFLQTHAND